MKLYLSRQANGLYMLTKLKPVTALVEGTEIKDLYFALGEPFGLRNLCQKGVKDMFGVKLKRYESIVLELEPKILNEE